MATFNNARHEKFAQELAKGKAAAEAYTTAGYRYDRGNAARLRANDNISRRVEELQAIGAARTVVTVERLISEAEEIRLAAMEKRQLSAAISAVIAKAKLAGLWLEKRKNLNRIDPDQPTDAQIISLIDAPPSETYEQWVERRRRLAT
jgi:hypothetical protein